MHWWRKAAIKPGSVITTTRICRPASPTRSWLKQPGVRYIDGSLCALGAGAGNSPTEVLARVFGRLAIKASLDVAAAVDAAADIVQPFVSRKMDRKTIV
jgi:hypothetical protein